MANGKIVWILGAGFSAHLGGPTLAQLFRPSLWERVVAALPDEGKAHFSGKRIDHAMKAALWLFNYGTRFDQGKAPWKNLISRGLDGDGDILWEDPEQFLDALDSAVVGGQRFRTLLEGHIGAYCREDAAGGPVRSLTLGDVADGARRLLAAECWLFLQTVGRNGERAQPYLRWHDQLLDNGDSILTFNYDRALEHLFDHRGNCKVVTIDPGKLKEVHEGQLSVMKLHGSIDWRFRQSKFVPTNDEFHWATCDQGEVGIASPGPTKMQSTTHLGELWDLALKRIADADAVVFMGYRFPPTDSYALEKIVGALRANKAQALRLHAVLGPKNEHSDRLELILKTTMDGARLAPSVNITSHPLYAQDFMTIESRHRLLP